MHRYYRCKLFGETGGQKCSQKTIRKDQLEDTVLKVILEQIHWFCNVQKTVNRINLTDKAKRKLKESKEKHLSLVEQRQKNVILANGLNEDYQDGILDDVEYCFLKAEYNKKIKELDLKIEELKDIEKTYSEGFFKNVYFSSNVQKYLDSKVLTEEMVNAFISRIEISDARRIVVKLNCKDEIQRMIGILKERGVDLDGNKE